MKKIRVVAAVFVENRLLIAQRSEEMFSLLWEVPGGKVENGENDPEALIRGVREGVSIEVEVNGF